MKRSVRLQCRRVRLCAAMQSDHVFTANCLMQVFSHPGLRSPTREQPCWALQHCYSLKTSLKCPFSDCKARGQQVGHWSNTTSHLGRASCTSVMPSIPAVTDYGAAKSLNCFSTQRSTSYVFVQYHAPSNRKSIDYQ